MEGFKSILITGACGFIGFHLINRLAVEGFEIIGLDNINDYYDVDLKYARLNNQGIIRNEIKYAQLKQSKKFENYRFIKLNLEDKEELNILFENSKFDYVINLAAQAGVRYSIDNPYAYINSNLIGFMNILEACRHNPVKHLYYASSSSVYGKNKKVPFSEKDNVDNPVSLYAATKKANELLAAAYHNLYDISCTGLRFFTVYGPWGRPDMAYYSFTQDILNGKTIKVFNSGDLKRDFTYIDDIIESIYLLFQKDKTNSTLVNRVLNIGNNKPENLLDFISILENKLGIEAKKQYLPMQQGDVYETYADIDELIKITGYTPKVKLKSGLSHFIKWYRDYYSRK
jgi:UDP-glucuronate 4-epimerase